MNITQLLVAGAAVAGLFGLAAMADAKGPPAHRGKQKNARARSRMVRPADAGDANAKGRIDISLKRGDRSDLRVMGQHLTPGAIVDFVISDPEGAGDETFGDDLTVNDRGAVHVFLKTRRGDDLPLGAETVADLEGREIRIQDNEGEPGVLLTGIVPSLDSDMPRRYRGRSVLQPETNSTTRGRIRLIYRRRDSRTRLVIGAGGFAPGAAVSFQMDAEGVMTEVGTAISNAEGRARYVVRTDHGAPLPLGATSFLDLVGLAVQVHADGVLHLTGNMPDGP